MYVSGFTFVRNAILYDYPVVESIRSLLPLCNEVVVAVGNSEDDTLKLVQRIADPKLVIIETQWDAQLERGGRVLAVETEKALAAVNPKADWCFYLQADEVLHEDDYDLIRQTMFNALNRKEIAGLLFDYHHFYGSFDYVGTARHWYRREVRIIRNGQGIKSWRDAQGFRTHDNQKLRVAHTGARVYHYGWVRQPDAQQRKQNSFNQLYHGAACQPNQGAVYEYEGKEPIRAFVGRHPKVMLTRIAARTWKFSPESVAVKIGLKERLSRWVEQLTGWRPGEYRNYRLLR